MSYEDKRYNMMVKIEEGKSGPSTKAYLDSKGLMTIGVGFNIAGNSTLRNAVLDTILPTDTELGNDAKAIKERGQLKIALSAYITQPRSANLSDPEKKAIYRELDRLATPSEWTAEEKAKYPTLLKLGLPKSFTLKLEDIRSIFDNIAPSFQKKVDNFTPLGVRV